MSSPSEEYLDKLSAQVVKNPSKAFSKYVPESVKLALQRTHTPRTQQMTKEQLQALKQNWLDDTTPKKQSKRVRFAGDTLNLGK